MVRGVPASHHRWRNRTLAGPVAAGRYAGDVTDARTGRGSSAKITTTTVGAGLKAKIRCKPRLGCPLAKRTKVVLASTGETYRYMGTFTLKGTSCRLDAYVYPGGFQGTYNCDGGAAGSIGGSSGGAAPSTRAATSAASLGAP